MAMDAYEEAFGSNNSQWHGTAAPTAGSGWPAFRVGDIMWNSAPASGQPTFWMCSVAPATAGAAGTWVASANAA